jgi:glycosyltransferase involved in cell wall biosynthesis
MTEDRNLRIGLLTSDFLPNSGGIAAHVAGLSTGLSRQGCRVCVIVPESAKSRTENGLLWECNSGVTVVRARLWNLPYLNRFTWIRRQVSLFQKIAVQFPMDVLHWHTPLAESEVAARVEARGKVFTNHTSQFLEWVLARQNPTQAEKTLACADVVVCPSQELVDATCHSGYPRDRVMFIPNGVDASRFSPEVRGADVRSKLGFRADEVVVLCPRRLEKKNGVTFWLDSIPLILASTRLSVRFLLVGDYRGDSRYSDREAVLRKMKNLALGDRLVWVGSVHPDNMPQYFAASDIVILPSLLEATSIAALEAMSTGKPIVATRTGGLPYLVKDNISGFLVDVSDHVQLARATLKLVENESLRRQFGDQARNRVVSEFTWESIANQTLTAYHRAIALAKVHTDH